MPMKPNAAGFRPRRFLSENAKMRSFVASAANRSLLVCLICWMILGTEGDEPHCRPSSKPGLRFVDHPGPATLNIGCIGEWTDLVCCTSGFTSIIWEQSRDGGKTWADFRTQATSGSRGLTEDGQVASIFNVREETDSGHYRCTAFGKDSEESIQNVVRLEIRNCSFWSDPPSPVNPKTKETEVPTPLAEGINITCLTFMGACDDSDSCQSGWKKMGSSVLNFTNIPEGNWTVRVRVVNIYRAKETVFESILSIASVTEDDYGSYNCWAENDNGFTDRTVKIRKYVPAPSVLELTTVYIGVVVLTTLLIVFFIVRQTRVDLKPQIWWAKRRYRRLSDVTKYDVTMLHSGDEWFSRYIENKLRTALGLRVFSQNDVYGNRVEMTSLLEAANISRNVLVVMTPELISNPSLVRTLIDAIPDGTPVFVFYSMDDNSLITRAEKSIQAAISASPPLRWPGMVLPDEAANATRDVGGEIDNRFVEVQPDDDEFWEKQKFGRVKIFWKQLELRLIKPMKRICVAA